MTVVLATGLILGLVPVYAVDDQETDDKSTTTTAEQTKRAAEVKREAAKKAAEAIKRAAQKRKEASLRTAEEKDELRLRAKELADEAKKKVREHTNEKKKANCQTRKQGLETKFSRLSANAQKHKERLDGILTRAIAYHDENAIVSAAYDESLIKAQASQAVAAASVGELAGLSPTVDCNNISVASDVALYKAAAEQARNDLKEYRGAIKAVLQSLKESGSES